MPRPPQQCPVHDPCPRFRNARLPAGPCAAALLILLLSAPGVPAAAQETDTLRLTLRSAVQYALDNNHDLAAARLEMERADEKVNEAWGTTLPKIDALGRYTRAIEKPVFFLPDNLFEPSKPSSGKLIPVPFGATHAMDMSLTAQQILFNSAVFIGVGAAGTYSRMSRDLFAEKRVATVTGARKGYYNVLLAHAVLGMLKQSMAYAEENLRTVRVMAQQGLVSEYDLLRSEVAVSNIAPEVIQAENTYRLALSGLKIALGLPYERAIAVEDTLAVTFVPDSLLLQAVDRALTDNNMLAALRRQTDLQDALVSVERSAYMPTLAAFGNYQWTLQANAPKFALNDFIASSQVGLSISMNIFNGLQTNARVDQARLEHRKSQEQVTAMEQATQTGAESTVGRLRRARERMQVQEKTVEQAERGYRIATTRYSSGAGTLLEVNDAHLAMMNAKVNRFQALYDYMVASADLDQLLGRMPPGLSRDEP